MSGLLGKIPKFTLKLPSALGKAGRTMSECPLELSFSLCEDNPCSKSSSEEQSPLEVILPPEKCEKQESVLENKETHEKAEEEKSEKEENMEVTCSVSVDGQEKQEFSFTLYDFDSPDKANKEDVEKVVVRSICEALGKTLKLPPSGSRTIKVKLAISPDSSRDSENDVKWPGESPETSSPCKTADYCSGQSGNTSSTYLMSSLKEKPPTGYSKGTAIVLNSHQTSKVHSSEVKSIASPKLRSTRHSRSISLQRQETKNCIKEVEKKPVNESIHDNRHQQDEVNVPSVDSHHLHKPQNSKDHVPECRDRRNQYLDLAGNKSNVKYAGEQQHASLRPPYIDPNYICPYRILDRTHLCSKSHRIKEGVEPSFKKPSMFCHARVNSGNGETAHVYRTKSSTEPQEDLLNLNIDLCDLVPEAKFDWEKLHHRRSKSYDLYENEFHNHAGLYSPKAKHKVGHEPPVVIENPKPVGRIGSSPGHHYRHRHREREKQRAMQQVASWIAREHSTNKQEEVEHVPCARISQSPQNSIVQRHEHHHLHEHIHHHYHHFVEF